MPEKVAVIGFGEAGPVFAKAFLDAGIREVATYDILIVDPATAARQRAKAEALGVVAADNAVGAVKDAKLVLSTVTADQAIVAATSAAAGLGRDQIYLDLNSISPGMKRQVANIVEGSGARFVEGVAMDTVPNFGARVPLLVSGPESRSLAATLNGLGLDVESVGDGLGQASAAKMLRSVFIKGFAALYSEAMLAAAALGLEKRIVDSLVRTFPGLAWEKEIAYYLGRSAIHAKRQAAEMRASAETVRELGVDPMLTDAIAARLQWAADLDLAEFYEAAEAPTIADYTRAVKSAIEAKRKSD